MHNKKGTKEVDQTHDQRRLASKNGHQLKTDRKKARGRPRQVMLDWMMTNRHGKQKAERTAEGVIGDVDVIHLNLSMRQRRSRK